LGEASVASSGRAGPGGTGETPAPGGFECGSAGQAGQPGLFRRPGPVPGGVGGENRDRM